MARTASQWSHADYLSAGSRSQQTVSGGFLPVGETTHPASGGGDAPGVGSGGPSESAPATRPEGPLAKRRGHTRSEGTRIARQLKRTFAWRISSIEQNRAQAQANLDRACTQGLGADTIRVLNDEIRKFEDQLRTTQAEAEAVHGPNWRMLIIPEHQKLAHELSMPAHLPTTIAEGEESGESGEESFQLLLGIPSSSHAATAPGGGGNAPPGDFDDIETINTGGDEESIAGSSTSVAMQSSTTSKSFAMVRPSAIVHGSPLSPQTFAAATAATIAAMQPPGADAFSINCHTEINDCTTFCLMIIAVLTVAFSSFFLVV